MKGKIALEEHFAIDDTLQRFARLLSGRRLGRGEGPRCSTCTTGASG